MIKNAMRSKFFHFIFVGLLFNSCSVLAEGSRFELRSAAFIPMDARFRDIYGIANADFQAQISTNICNDRMELWGNFAGLTNSGHSVGFHDSTRVSIFNCSSGVNFLCPLGCFWTFYVEAGPCIGVIWVKNDSQFVGKNRETKAAYGGIIKSGTYCTINDWFYIDFFVDYLYQFVNFKKRHTDIGGIKVGLGLGLEF